MFTCESNSDEDSTPLKNSEHKVNEKEEEENVYVDLTTQASPNHVEKVQSSSSNTEADKSKDSSSRNVFDAFPIDKVESDTTSQSKSEVLNESTDEIDKPLDSMKLRQFSERSKSAKNTDFLSSFESFLKSQQPCQQLSSSKTSSTKTDSVHNVPTLPKQAQETTKQSQESKVSDTSKKGKSLSSVSTGLSEKVKKNYPKLKELRVSLDSKEVLVHTNSYINKNDKSLTKKLGKDISCKSKKAEKMASDNELIETVNSHTDVASAIVNKENDKTEGMCDTLNVEKDQCILSDTLTVANQNAEVLAVSHHVFDSESAKPLKKRSRRGKRFDYSDKVNAGESDKILADNLTGKAADAEDQHIKIIDTVDVNVVESVVKDATLEPPTDGVQSVSDINSSELESNSNNEFSVQSCDTDNPKNAFKGKKKKGKSKRINSHSKKDVHGEEKTKENSGTVGLADRNRLRKSVDVNGTKTRPTKPDKLAIKRSVLHRKCTIVKKYPERTCNKMNTSEVETRAEKTFAKVKVKSVKKSKPLLKHLWQAAVEDTILSQTSDSVKPKKKRRRKVKPWSWGNEKKKYKPKIKILPVVSPVPTQKTDDTTDVLNDDMTNQNREKQTDQTCDRSDDILETSARVPVAKIGIMDNSVEIGKSETSNSSCMNYSETETNLVPLTSNYTDKLPKKSVKRSLRRKNSKSRKSKKVCLTAEENKERHVNEFDSELDRQHKLRDRERKEDCSSNGEMKSELSSKTDILNNLSEPSLKENINVPFCEESVPQANSNSLQSTNFKGTLKKGKRHKKGRKGSVKEHKNHEEQVCVHVSKFDSCKSKDLLSSEIQASSNKESCINSMEKLNEVESNPGSQTEDQHQHQDNEPRLDTVHVSTDSGIESVAGSPAGNESPNSVSSSEAPHSVAYHPTAVQFSSNNSTTTTLNKSVFADSIFATISSSVLLTCSSSATTSTDSLVRNLDLSNNAGKLVCTTTSSMVSSVCFPSESKTLTDENNVDCVPELLRSKLSNSTETLKEQNVGSISPSKKKNRAKFLQHFKTSVLLQQGRMPTESEKEQMLEDKFSYLNKVRGNETNDDTKLLSVNETELFRSDTTKSTCSSEPQLESDKPLHESVKTSEISNKPVKDFDDEHSVNITGSKHVIAVTIEQRTVPNTVNSADQIDNCDSAEITSESAGKEDTVKLSENFSSELHIDSQEQLSHNSPEHDTCVEYSVSTLSNNIIENNESKVTASASGETNTDKQSTHFFQKDKSETDSHTSSENINDDTNNLQDMKSKTDQFDNYLKDDEMNSECILPSPNIDEHDLKEEHKDVTQSQKLEMPNNQAESSQNEIVCEKAVFTASVPDSDQICKETEILGSIENTEQIKTLKKRGRPPGKKSVLLNVKKKLCKTFNVKQKMMESFKTKKKLGRPPKKMLPLSVKRKPGRPKGSKNKNKPVSVINEQLGVTSDSQSINKVHKNKPGRPKGSLNKPKLISANPVRTEIHSSFSLMQWRDNKEQTGLKKRKPGRPRKNPLSTDLVAKRKRKLQKKNGEYKVSDIQIQRDLYHHNQLVSRHIDNNNDVYNEAALDSVFNFPQSDNFNRTDLLVSEALRGDLRNSSNLSKSKLHLSGKKSNHKSKESKRHSKLKTYGPGPDLTEVDSTQDYDYNAEDLEMPNLLGSHPAEAYSGFVSGSVPQQSDRSIDSDTSGAGSSLGARSNFQFMFDFSKHKRKKNKKKLLYFKTKHKNIIDPVYVGEVDCLIRDFPALSISAPEETYIKVRPGEVPLPSIFKVSIINVKKKKKDKLSVFEKSRPLKHKNLYESDLRERVKLGRRKGIDDSLFEPFSTDLEDLQDPQYLPPKKRHKLFSTLDADKSRSHVAQKSQEKRKVGRPKKIRPPSSQLFSFGEYI